MDDGNAKERRKRAPEPELPEYQQRMADVAASSLQRIGKLTRLYVYARQKADPAVEPIQAHYEAIQAVNHALDQEASDQGEPSHE